ncbi:MAG: tryptophan synthase alpha chain [Crocinitomix sp.]|jgi:tryptophan synthase alpha chain
MKLNKKNNCSIFLTAGYPHLNSAPQLVKELENAGVDFIELGIPFSDPLADGPVIQETSAIALNNGMTLDILFQQVVEIKETTSIPIVLMGYFNPIYTYGVEQFLKQCNALGVDGLIIPDLELEIYEVEYKKLFEIYEIPLIFLITTATPVARIKRIAAISTSFIYLVSSTATTGSKLEFTTDQIKSFEKIKQLKLNVPIIVGFGIHNEETFNTICNLFDGAIIGSAFLRSISRNISVKDFVADIIG